MTRLIFFITLIGVLLAAPVFSDTSHVVAKGETLYSISRKYGITVAELCTENNITQSQVLKVGQKLVIPAKALPTTESYIVAKGDTFYGIARRHNMTVDELLSLNKLKNSDTLKVGGLQIEEYSDTSFTGTLNAIRDGAVFTSIPYDSNWRVYVDGERVERRNSERRGGGTVGRAG